MGLFYTNRNNFKPQLPEILNLPFDQITSKYGHAPTPFGDEKEINKFFKLTYGQKAITFSALQAEKKKEHNPINIVVVLSGGQAPGGHNVIAGLFDAMVKWNPSSHLYGALGGPDGLVEGKLKELSLQDIDAYRNTGGFDMIGSGRGKITTKEQFQAVSKVCKDHSIGAIVIIGGDDSNTNAAHLAEYFMRDDDSNIVVIGCPKTIDGDLKNSSIETSFGFDTATKTYSELIGNIEKDALSAKKYWFFIRLMGRSASHVALECALKTHPNVCLIGEEVRAKNHTLSKIVDEIADVVKKRAESGKNYGVCLIPEGIVEFIPEISVLIDEINSILAFHKEDLENGHKIIEYLSKESAKCYEGLPKEIENSLLQERDPHGNVQVSKIESEKLIGMAVINKLKKDNIKMSVIYDFFGYEGRSAYPSNFDATYCYTLGYNAFLLASSGATGYMSTVQNLSKPQKKWRLGGIPLVSMLDIEVRNGKNTPVIKKALVDLEGKPFKRFEENREHWALNDDYKSPGPIQYYGPDELQNSITITLSLESSKN